MAVIALARHREVFRVSRILADDKALAAVPGQRLATSHREMVGLVVRAKRQQADEPQPTHARRPSRPRRSAPSR